MATSHVNIRLCVRYGGVRPVCMETKALPSWTTGVEPLVEQSCLPTPWWTTRLNTLLLISSFPSLSFVPVSLPLAFVLNSSPRDSDSYSLETFPVLSSAANCSDYAQVSPPDHCGFIDTGRSDRSDLGAVRVIGVNDHGAVSPIVELNGKADSLASRVSFG